MYVELAVRVIGDWMLEILSCDILPGRFAVEGVRFSRGWLVGGRGAGPGFMNWLAE